MLIARALPIIHDINWWTIIITWYYLPALRREGDADIVVRGILLDAARRCGLTWMEDMAVRLDGAQATVSAITESPVFFGPPQHSVSLLGMAGLYHELGHNAFQRFLTIADNLAAVTFGYFSEFRRQAGPLTPEELTERNRTIDEALNYWKLERLNEVFCDVFATFVCGPAYYFLSVDMALTLAGDPFDVDPIDVHPPPAARVYVCQRALASNYLNEPFISLLHDIWNDYLQTLNRSSQFELTCASELLDRLVQCSVRSIETHLPEAERYEHPLPIETDLMQIPSDATLEILLNQGGQILLKKPEQYTDWEQKAVESLMFPDTK
ncbi:MAG: hypothetical protein FJ006_05445 [Chloroflexi bacterium]|nr:hypothetical protein [Chloroflexota bacterium]